MGVQNEYNLISTAKYQTRMNGAPPFWEYMRNYVFYFFTGFIIFTFKF